MMTTIAGSHRSVESHLQGPVGASGSFAPEASLGAGALATVTIAALNRQIDHLLDQRRIKRHAIPSDTTAGPTKLRPFLGFLWFGMLRGGLRTPKLQEVATFGDGATLDVPGSPRVILTPGHTPWSAVLHVPSRNLLLAGDALATYAVTTGARGPQVAPFTADAVQAVASLARLEDVSATLVLPGHGDPWTGGVQEAVRQVRQSAATRG
jgi:glyoxylase-like metal-dependent hydrolase (beta-lactamase superfamily II)